MRVLIVNAVATAVKKRLPSWTVVDINRIIDRGGKLIDIPRWIRFIHQIALRRGPAIYVLNMSMLRHNVEALKYLTIMDVIAIDRPSGLWVVKSRIPTIPTTSEEILLTWESFVDGLGDAPQAPNFGWDNI